MKPSEYLMFLTLPVALFGLSVQADTGAIDPKGPRQTECDVLKHGDVSTLDMAEYRARWSECFARVAVADRTCNMEMAHRDGHG